jgi:hypothetical protein
VAATPMTEEAGAEPVVETPVTEEAVAEPAAAENVVSNGGAIV